MWWTIMFLLQVSNFFYHYVLRFAYILQNTLSDKIWLPPENEILFCVSAQIIRVSIICLKVDFTYQT